MIIGMTAPRKATTTFDQMPMPNQMMISGSNVTRGTAFNVSTNGPRRYCARRDQPMTSPMTMPTMAAPT